MRIDCLASAERILSYFPSLPSLWNGKTVSPLGKRSAALALVAIAAAIAYIAYRRISLPPEKPTPSALPAPGPTTAAGLMQHFTQAWNDTKNRFEFPDDFSVPYFTSLLTNHAKRFKHAGVDDSRHYGYIEKFDLDPAERPLVYTRADLHGDLRSLMTNLQALQKERLLDASFKCCPGVHLIFLGDYCDRGEYGTQILELLMRLREENPEQVHLIRGNHESIVMHRDYGDSDQRLTEVVRSTPAQQALERFYRTMALTTYVSVRGKQREYVQFTHGLFEPTMDPVPLLDQAASQGYLPVPRARQFSERVKRIPRDSSVLARAAQRVQRLIPRKNPFMVMVYNWGDVTEDSYSCLGDPAARQYMLCAEDIKHYLLLSSTDCYTVKMLIRGHQHQLQHLTHGWDTIAITLTIGAEGDYAQQSLGGKPDVAYIIQLALQVDDWMKKRMLRYQRAPEAAVDPMFSPLDDVT